MGKYSHLTKDELKDLLAKKKVEMAKANLTQMTMKVALNSLYGCLGNQYFPFYKIENAEAITIMGQYFIRKCADDMNTWLQGITGKDRDYRIYGDTDSIFMSFTDVVEKYCKGLSEDKIRDKIVEFADTHAQNVITKTISDTTKNLRAFEPEAIVMEREAVCDNAFFVTKKKYALSIFDNEGTRLPTPKLKATGLPSKQAGSSRKIRKVLDDAFKHILYDRHDELKSLVSNYRSEFSTYSVEDQSENKGVNNIEGFLDLPKGTPYNVRAAIMHNKYVESVNLVDSMGYVYSGNKTKITYLKQPNPTRARRFAYPDDFHRDYQLNKYVDVNANFEHVFLKKLKTVTDPLGVQIEEKKEESIF